MKERYRLNMTPAANNAAIVRGHGYRFTVLTERLLRMEYQPDELFVDSATRCVINRDFPVPEFEVLESDSQLEIVTKYLHLTYDKKPFSSYGLTIRMTGNPWAGKMETWYYGSTKFLIKGNLKGTASNLGSANGDKLYSDPVDFDDLYGHQTGEVDMGMGLMSKFGYSVFNDGDSITLDDEGWVGPPVPNHVDIYFLCYGRDYLGCLKDYYHLTGKMPMLPRYALGNWWSRYYPYTQDEYMELMRRFEEDNIPISVSVLDMDWHITKVNPKYGSG